MRCWTTDEWIAREREHNKLLVVLGVRQTVAPSEIAKWARKHPEQARLLNNGKDVSA